MRRKDGGREDEGESMRRGHCQQRAHTETCQPVAINRLLRMLVFSLKSLPKALSEMSIHYTLPAHSTQSEI